MSTTPKKLKEPYVDEGIKRDWGFLRATQTGSVRVYLTSTSGVSGAAGPSEEIDLNWFEPEIEEGNSIRELNERIKRIEESVGRVKHIEEMLAFIIKGSVPVTGRNLFGGHQRFLCGTRKLNNSSMLQT